VADLALADQLTDRACDVLNRHIRVDPMLIKEIDVVRPEPSEGGLGDLPDVLGAAVHTTAADPEAELGGDDHPITDRGERLAHELLVDEGTVDLRSIEEGDAALYGRTHQRDHVASIRKLTVGRG
jgi:hypothetical protein